jgi:hypothetical protein
MYSKIWRSVYWCIVTDFGSTKLLQNVGNFIPLYTTWQEDGEEDVSRNFITLRKREDTGTWKSMQFISLWKNSIWKGLWTRCETDYMTKLYTAQSSRNMKMEVASYSVVSLSINQSIRYRTFESSSVTLWVSQTSHDTRSSLNIIPLCPTST